MADRTENQNTAFPVSPKKGVMNAIVKGAKEHRIINIRYIDSKGDVTERQTEPYEIKNNKYWAFSLDRGEVRQFNMERILEAKVTNQTFIPRWTIKIV